MKRTSPGREKTRRSKKSPSTASKRARSHAPKTERKKTPEVEACFHCGLNLKSAERALYVEEEVGRVFCTEECITAYFSPEIERLERDYLRRVNAHANEELSGDEREKLAHLRWMTLQEPDEVWREKTPDGDYRYTMISEFNPGTRRIWCVCITLCLRGEPSFLYLAFPTASRRIMQAYRKGRKIAWEARARDQGDSEENLEELPPSREGATDGLADNWSESETMRAQLNGERSPDDIPPERFESYQNCLEETLEKPDEVWALDLKGSSGEHDHVFHFIRRYPAEKPSMWYVVVAREVEADPSIADPSQGEAQMELLDAFPTVDMTLVERYRRGTQEVGEGEGAAGKSNRVVH